MRPHEKKLLCQERNYRYNENYQKKYKRSQISDRRSKLGFNDIKYEEFHKLKQYDMIIKHADMSNNEDINVLQYKKDFKKNQTQKIIKAPQILSDSTFFIKPKKRQHHYPAQRISKQRLDNQLEQYNRGRNQINEPKQRQDQKPRQKKKQQSLQKGQLIKFNKDESSNWNNESFKKQKHKSKIIQQKDLNMAFQNSLIAKEKPQKDDSGLWIESENILNQLSLSEDQKLQNIFQLPIINNNQSISYVSSIEVTRSLGLQEEEDKSLQYQNALLQIKIQSKQAEQSSEIDSAKIQKICNKIQQCQGYEQKDIILKFINKQNILEFKIKEIELIYLDLNLSLTIENDNIIVKDSIIQIDQLIKYVSFYKIHHIFPNIGFKQEQAIQFQFCRIKTPPVVQNAVKKEGSFIKKNNKQQKVSISDVLIKKIKLRCMNCMKFSTVPVIQEDNSAKLSCRQCNEKMQGRFSNISISK